MPNVICLYPSFKGFSLRVFIRDVKISNQLKKQLGNKCSVVKEAELSCFSTTEPHRDVSDCNATEEICNLVFLYGITRFQSGFVF